MEPGIYFDISNEDYHSGPGVSKSQLDLFSINPALLDWQKNAPVDKDKLKALDMGTALHCILLEPDEFPRRFEIGPDVNRRTVAGKQQEKEFIERCEKDGITPLTFEENRKLQLMRGSVFAHAGARMLMESEGTCESSIYWKDEETGELCRIRPDRFLSNRPLIADIKKVADMDRFSRHIEEFRYHVQAAMYCEGFKKHFGVSPAFAFIAVSETINCGRYPVRLFVLDDDDHDVGYRLFRRDLTSYHKCKSQNAWGLGFEIIQRPYWARNKDE